MGKKSKRKQEPFQEEQVDSVADGDSGENSCGHADQVKPAAFKQVLSRLAKGKLTKTAGKGRNATTQHAVWVCLACGTIGWGSAEFPGSSSETEHFDGKHCVGLHLNTRECKCFRCGLSLSEETCKSSKAYQKIEQCIEKLDSVASKNERRGTADSSGQQSDDEQEQDGASPTSKQTVPDVNAQKAGEEAAAKVKTDEKPQAVDGASELSNGIMGLQNLGNTCFFNSVMQNLLQTKPLLAYFRTMTAPNSFPLQSQMRHMCEAVWAKRDNHSGGGGKKGKGSRNVFNPSGVLKAVVQINKMFAGGRQQDSHELLRTVLDGMREEISSFRLRARREALFEKMRSWEPHRVEQWLAALGFEQWEEIKGSLYSSIGGMLNGDQLCTLALEWKSKSARKTRARFDMQSMADRLRLTRAVEYLRKGLDILVEEQKEKERKEAWEEHKNNASSATSVANPLDKEKDRNFVDDIFGGILENTVTCLHCRTVSQTEDGFFDLSLPVQPPPELRDIAAQLSKQSKASAQQRISKAQRKKMSKQKQKGSSKSQSPWAGIEKEKENKKKQKLLEQEQKLEAQRAKDKSKGSGKAKGKDKWAAQKEKEEQRLRETEKQTEDEPEHRSDDQSTKDSAAEATSSSDQKESLPAVGKDPKKDDDAETVASVPPPTPEPLGPLGNNRLKGACSIEDCLYAFTDPEILTAADRYGCAKCTAEEQKKADQLQLEEASRQERLKPESIAVADATSNSKTPADEEDNDKSHNDSGEDDTATDVEQKSEDAADSLQGDNPFAQLTDDTETIPKDKEDKEEEDEDPDFAFVPRPVRLVKRDAEKRFRLKQLPQVLTLHLKRFHAAWMGLEKVDKHVEFPLELDMAPFTVSRTTSDAHSAASLPPIWYRLFGMVVHSGSMKGGHYVAFVRKGDSPSSPWWWFSDSQFSQADVQQVLRQQAYILFYERV